MTKKKDAPRGETLFWLRLLLIAGFGGATVLLARAGAVSGPPAPLWTMSLLPVDVVALVAAFYARMRRQT